MIFNLLIKMLHILVLCRVLLIAGVQTLTIDSQLGTSVEDCFERISIGEQLPSDAIYRNVSELTNRECEQICKQDKQCQAYDYGVGAKGNATCNLSTLDEKTIKEQNPSKRHPDYDLYIRRFQCEQSPPTPIQPLSDDPGSGPQHRPVFRPEVEERPSAEDYLVSGDIGYGKPPSSAYRPDDESNIKPDYDAPPSYGDHKPQDIPYKPSRPEQYRPERPHNTYRPDRPAPPYGSDRPQDASYGNERPNDSTYGSNKPNDLYKPEKPNDPYRPRPETNDVLQFQGIKKPRPPADEYNRPDPYRPEKPEYNYIIRPNRKPRPQDDYPNSSKPSGYFGSHPSGPIGPPDRPYKPTRPYDKPSYSYQGQYASNYGQNSQNDNSIYVEINDPPRPYIPIKDRPNQQYNGQGYLGYGTYSSQNSYSQSQNSQYASTITELGGYGQNDRPYDTPQKPGYKPPAYNERPQIPGYGSSLDQKPQKPGHGTLNDNGYGNSGYGQRPNDYERPSYGHESGYSGNAGGTYNSNQVSYNTNKGSYTSNKGSYSSGQSEYGSPGNYGGNTPTNSNYGETGYGIAQKPNDRDKPHGNNQGSYGSQNSYHKGSYSSSYNEQSSHQGSYGIHASYESYRPTFDSQQSGYGQAGYQKPQKPSHSYDKPYGSNQDPYGNNQGTFGSSQAIHSSTQSSYSSSSNYNGAQGSYDSTSGFNQGSAGNYGSQSAYGSGQGSYSSSPGYENNHGSYSGSQASYGGSQDGHGSSSSSHGYGSAQNYGESQYADQSTYGGYGNRPIHDHRPGYGNNRPDYSNRPDYDYERPSHSNQKPGYGDQAPVYSSQTTGYGQKPSYDSETTGYGHKPNYDTQTTGYGQRPGNSNLKPSYNDPEPDYNNPKPGYNDPKPVYNEPKPGYNDPKPGYSDSKPGYNDQKPGYSDDDADFRPDVKPVYEYEMDKPNNVPVYISKPSGEVVTSRPVVIGDYGERPVYKDPGTPVKAVSYKGIFSTASIFRRLMDAPLSTRSLMGLEETEVWTSTKACFRRVLAGQRALRSFVRRVAACERLEDCRRECALEKRFHCESFNYRLDPSFRGKGLCELMTQPIEAFNLRRDFVQDKDYDFYEVDRNSLEPNCPETLRGPGLLHSGFLSSKDRPDRLDDRPSRPNRLDGWRDRNDWAGGSRHEDGRFKGGNRRYDDRFVPYEIGMARTDDDHEKWGQYGGIYGGSTYYKNRNDYHKSIHYWGLTSERPPFGVKPYHNKDEDRIYHDKDFDYHSLGKDRNTYDSSLEERNDYHKGEHINTFDYHDKDINDYHKDRNTYDKSGHNRFDYHSLGKDDGTDYHSLGKDDGEYHFSGEDYYGVGKTQHRYGYGAWKRGRWNSSGASGGFDFGQDLSKFFYEPVDRSDEPSANDCFSRRRPGMSLSTGAIRRSLITRNVIACEAACFGEKEFKCVSYSYRYSNSRGSDNCFLSERPFHGLDLSADSGSDVYAMPQDQGCSTGSHTPWIESECFYHVRSDSAVDGSAAKSTLTVAGLGACEAECIRAQGFFCRGFSFRFDSPTIGEELHNCILTSSPTTSLSGGQVRRAGGHELYARGNYGRGCEPHAQDVKDNGECYLQYDKAAKLTPSATRGRARVKDEQSCSAACTDAPFKCLSFSYNNNAAPESDNCLLSEIRLFDLQREVDYVHSGDVWLFAFDLFNSRCWRKVHTDEPSSEIPHPIIHTSSEEDTYPGSGPSGPGYLPEPPSGPGPPSGPPDSSYVPDSGPSSSLSYHPYHPEPEYISYHPSPSGPGKPYPIELNGPEKPVQTGYGPPEPSYPSDGFKPGFGPTETYKPGYESYKPGFRPDGPPLRPPDRDGYKPFRPQSRPSRPEPPQSYKPGYRPPDLYPGKPVESGFKPGFESESGRPGYGGRPGFSPEDKRPGHGTQRPVIHGGSEGGPLEVSWRHYTVSGFPCRTGTTCAQNHIVGHWACEPEGGEIGSWDYCCAPSHRCGYSEGFHKPWCYVGPQEDQWRPCSEKYYPYHQHNVPHPSSQGHREDNRPSIRPWQESPSKPYPPPQQPYTPHWDQPPGPYLSAADKQYWDDLYANGPTAYYDKYGDPLPGYSRVPTENRPRIKNRYNPSRPGSGNWVPVSHEDPTGVPGGLGAPRYWPVAYLHKSPPPNMTYFRYNETRPTTTTERYDRTTTLPSVSRELPSEPRIHDRPNDLEAKSSRDDKKINISSTDEVFSVDLENDTITIDNTTSTTTTTTTTEAIPIEDEKKINIPEVDKIRTESYKDRIDGIDDKLDDFSKSIEVFDIEDIKGDKTSDLKTLEAEEKQIEAIGRLLASRRGTKLVIEKRSQQDLENKNIAVDKDLVDFNFGNRFPTSDKRAERRGVIKRISKDEIERDRNIDRSLEVSETTFVRPPRVLSTTENIRKAIVNGKVFYDATIREQKDLFLNSTRRPKTLKLDDVTTFATNNNFREQRDLYLNSSRKPKHLRRPDEFVTVAYAKNLTQNLSRKEKSFRPIDDSPSISNIKKMREERDAIENNRGNAKLRRHDDSSIYTASNFRDHRDLYLNSTRKAKSLRRLEDTSAPSVIGNNDFGKRKALIPRNVNPVRRVRRVYRRKYNPEEVRKRLLERDRNKNNTDSNLKV